MEMFSRRIVDETPELHEEGVRMRFIGRRDGVSPELVERMRSAEALTDANRRITLFVPSTTVAARRYSTPRGGSREPPRRSSATVCTRPRCTTPT